MWVSCENRGRRDHLWYLSSPCISITRGPSSALLSLHLSPSSLGFLRKITTWLLTLIFQHLSECDRLSFVSPLPFCVPTFIHPPTHPAFSLPQPPSVIFLPFPPMVQPLPCDRRGGDEKTKTNQAQKQGLFVGLSGCLSVSLFEFFDTYTTINPRWGEVSLPLDARLSSSGLDTHRQCFRLTGQGSDLIHRDRHRLRIEVCVFFEIL